MVEISESQKKFCEEYVKDFNATRAYKVAYPKTGYDAARSSSSNLLAKSNIKGYIQEIQKDLSKLSGITRLKVLNEFSKLAFSSIADLHNTWIDLKDFENLTDDQKACIQEIQHSKLVSEKKGYEKDQVKIKLYSKVEALKSIMDMLGFKAPEELNVSQVSSIRFTPVKTSSNGVGNKVQ